MSGRIRVVDHGAERRLVVDGDVMSVYPKDGDWTDVRREYWWHAVAGVGLPRRPAALLLGLGGGTQVHLLARLATPRLITVVERDPVIIRVAHRWFGLRDVGRVEFLCGDMAVVVPALVRSRRRFDFVMDDAAYADTEARSLALGLALAPLVSERGVLVLNRHGRRDAANLARALARRFRDVRARRVRREAENVLVYCRGPRA